MKKTKLAIIIANREFRDEEYFETKYLLEKGGFNIVTFSNEKGVAIGKFGGEIMIDNDLKDLNTDDFDGIIFVGGPGAIKCLDNNISYSKIREGRNKDKLVAAICIAPLILYRAGVLKKGTVWSSDLDKSAVKELGNTYKKDKVVRCENIITANGPRAIKEFANCIIRYFNRKC